MIDKKSRIPLYAQLIDIVMHKINSGELKEYEKLPSERELCDQYNISRTTIRQAMIELENDGYIYKEHGKGSFVSPSTYTQSLSGMYSFTEEMRKLGKKPRAEILSFLVKPSSSKVAKELDTNEGEDVYEIARLRLADDEPIMIETTYLPAKYFPNLSKEDLTMYSMYELFQIKYQLLVNNAQESFKAVRMPQYESEFLLEDVGTPAMKIIRVAYSNDKKIEYTVSFARGDKYVYSTELK